MIVEIQSPHVNLPVLLKERIQKKVAFTFKRVEHYISNIVVTLDDVNGPKGGKDKSCCLTIKSPDMSDIVVTGVYDSLYQSIERTCERAKKALTNQVDKKRSRVRREQCIKRSDMTL